MFEHYSPQATARRPLSTPALAAATAAMIGLGGLTIYAVAWLMSALGFTNIEVPVAVSYDPYGNGDTLELLIGGDRPPPIEDSASPPR